MAEINVRKRGAKWEYRFEGARINGKRNQITKGGFRTKKDALAAGTKALSTYNSAGTLFTPSEISVSDYFTYWIKNYCKPNLKIVTWEKYKTYIRNHLNPAFGEYKLKALTTAAIQEFINGKFNEGYSRNTLMNLKGVLTGSLDYAVNNAHFISFNPATPVKVPSSRIANPKTRKKERVAITSDQMNQIFKRFPKGHSSYIPLLLGYRCGLRIGETFALTWDDIDLTEGYLDINKQIQWVNKKWKFYPPKYNSNRKIRIDDILIQELNDYKARQQALRKYYAEYYTNIYVNDDNELDIEGTIIDMVTRKENGSYLQSRSLQHTSHVIHTQLGMPQFDYHTLRHTHTTMLIEAGANIKDVQHRLGHKNIQITLNIYSHSTPEMEMQTVNILNNIQ